MLTTPWGLALTAAAAIATAALILWTDAAGRAAAQARLTAEGVEAFYQVLKAGGSGSDLRDTAVTLLQDKYEALGTSITKVAAEIGVSTDDMITGLASNGSEGAAVIDAFNAKIRELQDAQTGLVDANGNVVLSVDNSAAIAALQEQRDTYQGLVPSIEAAREKLDEYNRLTSDGIDTAEEAAQSQKALEDALKAAGDAAKLAAKNSEGNQFLEKLAGDAAAATRAIEIYNGKLQEGLGRNRDYEDSQASFNQTILDVPDVFKKAAEGVGYSTDALKTWNTQNLTLTEGGQQVYKSIRDISDAATDSTVRAYEHARATHSQADAIKIAGEQADNSYNQFIGMHDAMGLTEEEAIALAAAIGLVDAEHIDPKIFDIIANDQQAQATAKLWESVKLDPKTLTYIAEVPAAQPLADLMNEEIHKTQPDPIPVTPEVQPPTDPTGTPAGAAAAGTTPPEAAHVKVPVNAVPEDLPPGPVGQAASGGGAQTGGTVNVPVVAPAVPEIASAIADIEGDTVTVVVGANTGPAWSAVQLFKAAATVPLTVVLNGNAAPVNGVIRAVIGGQYSTTVHLNGDSVPVNNVIRAVIGGSYSTTVHIGGDNSGAISSIRSITMGYYSATVHINAEASGFYSVWNSLPSSKTITVTVNQVQGSVVAPAPAPGGLMVAPQVAAAATQRGFMLSASPRGPVATGNNGENSNLTINIQGGIESSDSIARAVKRVVLGRDRRTGGVVIGEMRARVGHS
jgi:hypothetical protein